MINSLLLPLFDTWTSGNASENLFWTFWNNGASVQKPWLPITISIDCVTHEIELRRVTLITYAYLGPMLPAQQLKIISFTFCGRNVRLKSVLHLQKLTWIYVLHSSLNTYKKYCKNKIFCDFNSIKSQWYSFYWIWLTVEWTIPKFGSKSYTSSVAV